SNIGYSGSQPHVALYVTNSAAELTTNAFDTSHRFLGQLQPSGLVITNAYGTDGFVAGTTNYESGGSVINNESFTWTNGLMRTRTDPRGLTTTFTWDYLGRKTKVEYPDGSSETFGYRDA